MHNHFQQYAGIILTWSTFSNSHEDVGRLCVCITFWRYFLQQVSEVKIATQSIYFNTNPLIGIFFLRTYALYQRNVIVLLVLGLPCLGIIASTIVSVQNCIKSSNWIPISQMLSSSHVYPSLFRTLWASLPNLPGRFIYPRLCILPVWHLFLYLQNSI